MLGPIWAIANGLFVEYFAVVAISMLLAVLLAIGGLELVAALIVVAGFVYFSVIAHRLRAKKLVRSGYDRVATIESSSARNALREWAESDQASGFLETGTPNRRR